MMYADYNHFCAPWTERLASEIRWYFSALVRLIPDLICMLCYFILFWILGIIAALFG